MKNVPMNPVQEIKTTWQSIPPDLKSFLKRALLIFIVWKLVYHLFLFNGRVIDKPLTDFSAKSTEWVLQLFYPGSEFNIIEEPVKNPYKTEDDLFINYIYKSNQNIVGVADGCNALELYVLYLGFLIAFPSTLKRLTLFGFFGIAIIFAANIIRLVALAAMNMNKMHAVEIAHHYLFKLIVYAIIFFLWMVYTGKIGSND